MEHVTPATRLLEKRRQMFDVQESLEHQKVEFNRKEEGGEEEREVLQMVRSYVRGVNETIADLTSRGKVPWELSLLKIDVSAPWTPEDVLGIMHVLAFKLSFGFQGPIVKHALIQALGEGIASEWFVSNSIPEAAPNCVGVAQNIQRSSRWPNRAACQS